MRLTIWRLVRRSLRFHARAHFGVLLGAIIGSAALTGALLVGDSVRETLREKALERLANASFALAPTDRFFREELQFSYLKLGLGGPGMPMGANASGLQAPGITAKLLSLSGIASLGSADTRANQVQVFGATEELGELTGRREFQNIIEGTVIINRPLANQLRAQKGDEIVIRVHRGGRLSTEAAISPRGEQSVSLRLKVAAVLEPGSGADLALHSAGAPPLNAFVAYSELARRTQLEGKMNVWLTGPLPKWSPDSANWWSGAWLRARQLWSRVLFRRSYQVPIAPARTGESLEFLANALKQNWKLQDVDFKLDYVPDWWGVELRSSRVFLEYPVIKAAARMGTSNRIEVLTYLANLMATGTHATPYSMVTAAGPPYTPPDLADDEIVISQWLADDLQAQPGQSIDLSYFLPESGANLREATNRFRIHSIVPRQFPWADRTLMPDFPGIESAETAHDWDAGFPLVHEIRPQDDQYWKEYRGTPKAFITLAAGQKLWANRFGSLTAVRFPTPAGMATGEYWFRLQQQLLSELNPAELGLRFEPVREQALKAAEQAQDFGQLFLGFSIFLVTAALLLMGLLFHFGLEQRSSEIGTLLALGFVPRQIRRLFLGEGVALALIGGIIGALCGLAYARVMVWALTTVWRNATGNASLQFHVGLTSLALGMFASAVVASLTIALTLRRQGRQPARELLAGTLQSSRPKARSRGTWLALSMGLGSIVLVAWAIVNRETANAGVFFGAGAMLLLAGLGFAAAWMNSLGRRTHAAGLKLAGLGVRGCARRPKRSLTTIALLASGCFVVIAIGVFRLDANRDASRPSSGTGGFALLGQTSIPVVQDLGGQAGRDFFGLNEQDLRGFKVIPLRVLEGDDASCLNLNRAQRPRVLGVNPEALAGRFTFTKAAKGLEIKQGWDLLRSSAAADQANANADTIPAVGDANSIQWALGKKIGDTLDYTDENGRPFKLRLVGAVANSILQGSLLIDEAQFIKRFPTKAGYQMFLLDVPSNAVVQVSATLTRALQDVGLELTSTVQRLEAFNAVQNTYLGTFQILGGLGLLLGSAGLGVVVMRNVFERRGELALLTAVGFRRRALKGFVLGEHGVLLALGLGLGIVSAMVAVLPALLVPGTQLPFLSLGLTLGAVLLNGALWTFIATGFALKGNLLDALRNE